MPNYSTAMSRAVIDYIMNFYFNIASTVNMYHIAQPENLNLNLDVMNEILYHVKTKIVVQIDSLMDLKLSSRKRINNLIFIDSFESFMIIFKKMNFKHFEYQGYYLIIVTAPSSDIYLMMLKIFEALWTKYIINSNIIFMPPGNRNEAIMYTYYPYSYHYCEDVVPIQLNHFKENQWLNKINYFPRKLQNFHGCHLRVATFNSPPFMIINQNAKGVVTVDGLEGILLRVLAQKFNFVVDLYRPKESWGTIYPNGSTDGAIKMILDGTVNMTLGFFASMPNRDKIMEPSYVYYTTNLVWTVPQGKPQTALEKLANPLHTVVWIMSIVTSIIGLFVIAAIKKQPKVIQNFVFGNKIQSPGMNFINVVLGNSLHALPMRNFSRFLLLLAMIYYFIIRTCYSSGLVKFMQMDTRGKHMMSTAEMVENNFTFYMMDSARIYVTEMPEVLARTKMLTAQEFNRRLLEMIVDPYYDGGFLTSTGHLAYRNMKVYPKMFHESAPTPVYTLNIVIYMSMGSCLRITVNEFILSLISSGLINKWASFFIDTKYLKKPPEDELAILSIKQLEGAFQLLIGGLFVGFIIFCAEKLISESRFEWFKNAIKRKFDGKKLKNLKILKVNSTEENVAKIL